VRFDCSEGIPSKNKFKYEERAKLLPEKTSALLQKRGAMATYDALVKELADSPSGMFGSWAGGAKHLWEITSKFESQFETCKLKIYLCKQSTKDGEFWWFMFEDLTDKASGTAKSNKCEQGSLWKEYGSDKNLGGGW